MEIFFLRHAESEGVKTGKLQGHVDYPLTDQGRAQIHELAAHWQSKSQSFDRIISSPLRRAKETSEIVASHLDISAITEEPLWIERDFGKGEGKDLQVIADWYKSRPMPSVFEPVYDTGETEWQVHVRAAKAIEKLMNFPEGIYLVVSHGNVINAAIHTVLGIFPYGHSLPGEFALNPACYARFNYAQESARWSLLSFNVAPHTV